MQGRLSAYFLIDVLKTVYNERRSGELSLRRDAVEKHIFFERGQAVFAVSNCPEDRLGEVLVRHRRLTEQQLKSYLAQVQPGQRFGQLLIDYGVITHRELINYVTLQISDIIRSVFNWTDGFYQFSDGDNRTPEDLQVRVSTATLILEAVRTIDDFDTIRRAIGNPALLLVSTSRSKLQSIAFSSVELYILNTIKEPTDLLKLIVACKERPEKVLQAIYGLLSIGLIEQVDEETARILIAQPRTTGAHQRFSTGGYSTVNPLLVEIEEMKRRIETRNPYVVLGTTPESSQADVYSSYVRLMTKFSPEKYTGLPAQLKTEVDQIFVAITESYNIIRNQSTSQSLHYPSSPPAYGAQPPSIIPPSQMPNIGMRSPSAQYPPQNYQAPPSYPQYPYPPQPGQMAQAPNPLIQAGGVKRTSITRAVSDELEYKGESSYGTAIPRQIDVEQAMSEMLDYFDDKRAPLFASDALSLLLRTKAPVKVERRKVVETIVNWARNKSAVMGWSLPSILVRVIGLIKQAESAQLIESFDGKLFYPGFIQEIAGYCSPMEAEEFMRGVSGL
ncbi:MAG: DUF4388 domain-containing protein [Blastocatellia bacterium]|nr:DUF4388 domain-containing protein [Blastocatellia bacterium]